MNIKKYFWSLNPRALKEVAAILRDPQHPRFLDRLFTLLARCDNPREVFSVVSRKTFIKIWPRMRRYWAKTKQAPDFKAWWETVYEQLLRGTRPGKSPKGKPSETFIKIGRFLRAKRMKKKISQRDFAARAGMTQPDISAIEAGKKNITIETLSRLCRTLGIKTLPFS